MADPVSRLALAGLVEARLQALEHVTVYVGEVLNDDGSQEPPLIPDSGGRVAPYVVLLSGDGAPIDENPLCGDTTGSLIWPFQVRCGAGFHADVLNLLDGVHGLLDGWAPTLAGYQFGFVEPPPGYDAGPVRRLEQTQPPRYVLPTQFRLAAHRVA